MLWSPRSATREQCTCCSEDLVQPKKKKKKTVYYAHTSQEKEYMSHDGGAQGTHQGQPLGRRSGELWVRACIVVSARREGLGKQTLGWLV